jgi:hypothetical protein
MESVLRAVFFWLMTPDELADHLDREAAYFHGLAAKLRELADAKDRGAHGQAQQAESLRVAAEAGIGITQSLGDWAEWAKRRASMA